VKSQEEINKEENYLRNKIQKLSDNNKEIFYSKIEKEIKDPDTYAVLNWLFIAGIHHFYLKRWLNGTINLIIFLVGVILSFSDNSILFGMAIGMLLSLFIIELIELFKSQLIVQDYNNQMTKKLLGEFQVQ
jgi:TM2 domain-containing membrane protein YozV